MKKQLSIITLIVIVIIIITISLTYAYFTANLTGTEDSTTITVTGGSMNITYDGGADINIHNIIPSGNPAAIKSFTVTGNNTLDLEMAYKLSLIVEENTFTDDALKYKLISTNTDNSGEVALTINELTNLGTGAKTIDLGVGYFEVPTIGNKVHTYNLEIYFPNQDYNQNIDQEKQLKAYILIENYVIPNPLLIDLILAQDGGISLIESKTKPDFSKIAVSQTTYDALPLEGSPNKNEAVIENGLYAEPDEYGMSYYYRGEKELLNNNLIFGGFQWKIIRINGDNSIRIIYNGTEEQYNINGIVNDIGALTHIGNYAWNKTYEDDAKYVGYMYGGANGDASTSRSAAVYNQTASNVKTVLESWYQNNLFGKAFENYIVDNLFCNDRRFASEVGGYNAGPGYGNTGVTTNYAVRHRLQNTKNPSLKCEQKNDRFTFNNSVTGNNKLKYPIGLVTADEVAFGGIVYELSNDKNYFNNNLQYWTFTPLLMSNQGFASLYIMNKGRIGNVSVDATMGLRPVINISSEIRVVGDGSSASPYKAF